MAFSLGEYQDIFLEEADEQLQELNQNLLELEKNPDDLDIINNIFRAAHSLKSSAAFVGLNDLSDLAHKMENLLQGLRDRTMQVTPDIVDVVFECFDSINSVIETVASGVAPDQDMSGLINKIQDICSNSSRDEQKSLKSSEYEKTGQHPVPDMKLEPGERKKIKYGFDEGQNCIDITIYLEESASMKWIKAQLILSSLERISEIVKTVPAAEEMSDDSMGPVFRVIIVSRATVEEIRKACDIDLVNRIDIRAISIVKKDNKLMLKFGESEVFITGGEDISDTNVLEDKVTVPADQQDPGKEFEIDDDEIESHFSDDPDHVYAVSDRKKAPLLKTIKVSVEKLDLLLNNVAELVIANSGFYKLYDEMRVDGGDKAIINDFKNRIEQMSRIAKDLQTGIMKTRMVTIGQVFNRFNRLVRDLAREFNKRVELTIRGEDTELDKKVIDVIFEPLLHLIRNAIDHGIEPIEERRKLGKTETASVILNAYQGGNQIFVEVSDDGRGLDIDSIKTNVLEKGLATREVLNSLEDDDIFNYIFHPGVSTADKITDISGRGVGMNVVKETVNELNGNVSIETEPGMGTRFVLTFPLTLAIIPAIMVRISNEMYAVPLSDVNETIKISPGDITRIEGQEVINLRGEILSLLRLSDFVKKDSILKDDDKIPVVVVSLGNRKIGLMVDVLEGKQEIVIKSLEQNYKTVPGLSGASILGDGSICLILDVSSMINMAIEERERILSSKKMKMAAIVEADVQEIDQSEIIDIDEKQPSPEKGGAAPAGTPSYAKAREDEAVDADRAADHAVTAYDKEITVPASEETRGDINAEKVETPYAPLDEGYVEKENVTHEEVSESGSITGNSAPALQEDSADSVLSEDMPGKDINEDEIGERVKSTLDEFRDELRSSVRSQAEQGDIEDHIKTALEISREDLNQLQSIANTGAANAAESLSKIISTRVDLSIPEVRLLPTEKIPSQIGEIDNVYIGVMLSIIGNVTGTLLFVLKDHTAFQLIDILYGNTENEVQEIDEDGESALKELTNIIGSSVLNVFADKSSMDIKPSIPTIVHDYLQSIIDSILVMHNMSSDYAVLMDAAFFFEDDSIIGNLLLIPEADSLKIMLEKMKTNVGSD